MSGQGASGNPQGAGDRFVKFSRQSAQRIAKAVRVIEAGDRVGGGIAYDHHILPSKMFRIAVFTAAWSKNAQQTVTFKYQTNTPNTAVATNVFVDIAAGASSRNCAIAREGTAWYLISAEC